MTREDKQSVISICRILADKMDDSGKVAVEQVISAVQDLEEQLPEQEPVFYPQVEGVTPTVVKQEPCDDAISRQAVLDVWHTSYSDNREENEEIQYKKIAFDLPSVNPQPKTGHCKDCKYFEYNSWEKVNGIPLIVAHEICSKWGSGCKTSEEGYCFLFEPQESEEQE